MGRGLLLKDCKQEHPFAIVAHVRIAVPETPLTCRQFPSLTAPPPLNIRRGGIGGGGGGLD